MNQASKTGKLIYIPKPATTVVYLLFLILALFVFMGRKNDAFTVEYLVQMAPDFYQHISNFSISYLLYAGIGYFWLLLGVDFKYIAGLGAFLLVSNFVYEAFLPILNTPDLVDAYYGFAGTILGFTVLFLVNKFGLTPTRLLHNKNSLGR